MRAFRLTLAAFCAVSITAISMQSADAGQRRIWDPRTKTFMEYGAKPQATRTVRRAPRLVQRSPRLIRRAPSVVRGYVAPRQITPHYTRALAPAPRFTPPTRSAPKSTAKRGPDPKYDRQIVDYATDKAPGSVVIDTRAKFLYYVMENGKAMRYGVGVGREGFGWKGETYVGYKKEWPTWTPPAEMIDREPKLAKYSEGMPGGLQNPLGARAIYLYRDGKDTLYRVHGTNEPWSIGGNVSSGCIRMENESVIDLYNRIEKGASVTVI